MKRVVSLISALCVFAGAFAPAIVVYADDLPQVYSGQVDPIPLDDLDQQTYEDYFSKFFSLEYPSYTATDLYQDVFEGILSNYCGVDTSVFSWASNLVDSAVDKGVEIGLWFRGVELDPITGKVIVPEDALTEYGMQQLDSQLKTVSSGLSPDPSIAAKWTPLSMTYGGYCIWSAYYNRPAAGNTATQVPDCYITGIGTIGQATNGFCVCSYQNSNFYINYYPGSAPYNGYVNSLGAFSATESYTGNYYKYGNQSLSLGLTASYSSVADAVYDFYNHILQPGASWNGSGYYVDDHEAFTINLPALPAVDWGGVSNYYYTTYGQDFTEPSEVDYIYYNYANNYFPADISYELPYWLINGNIEPIEFSYDLELPSAAVSDLPAELAEGSSFWDDCFTALGSFGIFVLTSFSFTVVGLFFKG